MKIFQTKDRIKVEGLKSLATGRPQKWPAKEIIHLLPSLLKYSPQHFGWLGSRWSIELLSMLQRDVSSKNIHQYATSQFVFLAGIV